MKAILLALSLFLISEYSFATLKECNHDLRLLLTSNVLEVEKIVVAKGLTSEFSESSIVYEKREVWNGLALNFTYYGRNHNGRWQSIGDLFFIRENEKDLKTLKLDLVKIKPDYRGKGVQSSLFNAFIKVKPEVQNINLYLAFDNEQIFVDKLVEIAERKYEALFIELVGASPTKFMAVNFDIFKNQEQRVLDELFQEAYQETPMYKTASKNGFFPCTKSKTIFLQQSPEFENHVEIHVKTCRK